MQTGTAVLWMTIGLSVCAASVWAGETRGVMLTDLAQCNVTAAEIEIIDELTLTSGARVKAEDKANHLLAVWVAGTAVDKGELILNARQFGASYRVEEHIGLTVAKAVGCRVTNKKGEIQQIWTNHNGNAIVLSMDGAGEKFRFALAFEIPKRSASFQLSYPTVLDAAVRVDPVDD